jgi:hypothetical protein
LLENFERESRRTRIIKSEKEKPVLFSLVFCPSKEDHHSSFKTDCRSNAKNCAAGRLGHVEKMIDPKTWTSVCNLL